MTRRFVDLTGHEWQHAMRTRATASDEESHAGDIRTLSRRLQATMMLPHRAPRFLSRGVAEGPPTYLLVSHHHLHQPKAIQAAKERLGANFVCFIHDLIPIEYPEFSRPNEAAKHRVRIETALQFADAFVVNSAATRDSLLPHMRAAGRDVPLLVAPLGVHAAASMQPSAAAQSAVDPYFLYIGTIEPRKNHLLLFHVWRRLVLEMGEAAPRLILVGHRGWENEMVIDVLERSEILRNRIVEHNALPDEKVQALIAGARAVLLPSFAEGYGLPVAEALALGTPVLCSDLPALREVGGTAAEYLDPLDGLAWMAAVRDYTSGTSRRRQRQLDRIAQWVPPSWQSHIDAVMQLINGLGRAGGMSAPVRVGIDGMNLAIARGTGVATYARSLADCLTGMGHPVDVLYGMNIPAQAEPAAQEIAFFEQLQVERGYRSPKYPSPAWCMAMLRCWRGEVAREIPLTGLVEARPMSERLPRHDRLLNGLHLFARAAQYFRNFGRFMTVRMPNPPAIMHWTYPVPLRLEGARNIYTVHDLVPLRMPYATLDNKPIHMRLLQTCLRDGDHVVTVSERSRDDLLEFFPAARRGRVTNTYQAVQEATPAMTADQDARLLMDGLDVTPGGYFLFFGSIEPKKNVGRLLQAFLAADIAIPLVIVTARGWQSDGEAALLKRAGEHRIRQIDYVSQELLGTLIRGARAVTFPSLYEGFGLPVVEAMRCGTPVLTSREGSLPEVAGDAALYVDAYDVGSIAEGLVRLASDDALCAELRRLGPIQAERFSMQRYAARLDALYGAVLAGEDAGTTGG